MSWLICGSTSVVAPRAPKIYFVPTDSETTKLSEMFTKEQEEKEKELETIYPDYDVVDRRFTKLELRVADLEARFKPLDTLETLEKLEAPEPKPEVEVEVPEVVVPEVHEVVVEVEVPEPKPEVEVKVEVPAPEVVPEVEVKVEEVELTTVTAFPTLEISEVPILPSVVLPELVLDTKEVLAGFFKTLHEEINYIEKNMNAPLPMALIEQLKRLSHDAKIPLPRSPRLEPPRLR